MIPFYIRHRDDEWYDEVRIICVPRYKTSGLSGDEWRFSYRIQLLRKGVVVREDSRGRLQYAVAHLASIMDSAGDKPLDMYQFEGYCANPGCREKAVSEYRLKKEYSREGMERVPFGDHRIRFCQRHLRRGDGGLQDSDRNYEVVSGPGPSEAKGYGDDISESAYGGTIEIKENP